MNEEPELNRLLKDPAYAHSVELAGQVMELEDKLEAVLEHIKEREQYYTDEMEGRHEPEFQQMEHCYLAMHHARKEIEKIKELQTENKQLQELLSIALGGYYDLESMARERINEIEKILKSNEAQQESSNSEIMVDPDQLLPADQTVIDLLNEIK